MVASPFAPAMWRKAAPFENASAVTPTRQMSPEGVVAKMTPSALMVIAWVALPEEPGLEKYAMVGAVFTFRIRKMPLHVVTKRSAPALASSSGHAMTADVVTTPTTLPDVSSPRLGSVLRDTAYR